MPSARVCYVSNLDLSIPRPEQMKFSMEQMSLRGQFFPTNVTVKKTGWKVVGYASRLDLPQTIIEFCGGFPIFRVEKTPLNFDNVKSMVRRGHERWRRSQVFSNFSSCSPEGTKKWLECVEKENRNQINYTNGVHVQFDVTCTYRTHDCFYVYTCKPKGGGDYECSQEAHFLQYTGICCVPIC